MWSGKLEAQGEVGSPSSSDEAGESQQSEGGDELRRVGPRQLSFAFADSPRGGKGGQAPDESGGRAYLLHAAKGNAAKGPAAGAADGSGLLEQVASVPNLAAALLKVRRNRGAPGVDGRSVDEVETAASWLLPKLRRALLDGSYQPGDIRRVWIPKPGGGRRGLGVPNVVDRWVQQAMLQILQPLFEPGFHKSSHGFRPGRGAGTAIAEAKDYVADGGQYVVDIDLAKFFDRVPRQRLLSRLAGRIEDGRVLKLVHQMLKARVVLPDGTRVATEEGTCQGGPLSPLLANNVLDELDWEMERRGLRFVRYADDMQVYVGSERAGARVVAGLRRFIEGRMRLEVNEAKSAVARPGGCHFLGFRLVLGEAGEVEVHLSPRSIDRIRRRIRELTPCNWGRSIDACVEGVNRYIGGWVAYFRLCSTQGAEVFLLFDAHIRRRIRCIIVRQQKRPRYLFRHLRRRRVSWRAASRTAFRSVGPWKKSNLPGMTRAYPNAWFRARMVSAWDRWQELNPPPPVSGQYRLPGM